MRSCNPADKEDCAMPKLRKSVPEGVDDYVEDNNYK